MITKTGAYYIEKTAVIGGLAGRALKGVGSKIWDTVKAPFRQIGLGGKQMASGYRIQGKAAEGAASPLAQKHFNAGLINMAQGAGKIGLGAGGAYMAGSTMFGSNPNNVNVYTTPQSH